MHEPLVSIHLVQEYSYAGIPSTCTDMLVLIEIVNLDSKDCWSVGYMEWFIKQFDEINTANIQKVKFKLGF